MPNRYRTPALLAGLATVLLGCMSADTKGTAKSATAPNDEPAIEASIPEIANAVLANPIEADQKYLGKRIRFGDQVEQIGSNRDGYFVVTVGGETVYPAKEHLDAFGRLREGDQVVFEGILASHYRADTGAVIRCVFERAAVVRVVQRGK